MDRDKKSKVAILVNSLAGGGAEKVALTLLEELHRRDFPTMLICLEKEAGYDPPSFCEVLYLTQFSKITNPFIKTIWILISASRLKQLVNTAQIDVLQSHLIRSNLINALAKRIGSNHWAQVVTHTQLHLSPNFLIRWGQKLFFRTLYQHADQIVSITRYMRKNIDQQLNLTSGAAKHVVIPNPHDLSRISSLAKESPTDFNFDPDKRYVISAGRLLKLKRLDVLLKAMISIGKVDSGIELIVLGEGQDRSFYEQLVKKYQLNNKVHFLGHKSNPFSYIAAADAFVLSSETEGLPNIIIEALACETPVISSDCISGPREILHPESDWQQLISDQIDFAPYGLLYPIERDDLLAEAILRVLHDEKLSEQLREKGLQYVEKYNKEHITNQYWTFFRDIHRHTKNSTSVVHENKIK